MLAILVLSKLREQINEYLDIRNKSQTNSISNNNNNNNTNDRNNLQYLCTEVLLGIQIWCNMWIEKGYTSEIVNRSIEIALNDTNSVTNSHFLQILNRVNTSMNLLDTLNDNNFNDNNNNNNLI